MEAIADDDHPGDRGDGARHGVAVLVAPDVAPVVPRHRRLHHVVIAVAVHLVVRVVGELLNT